MKPEENKITAQNGEGRQQRFLAVVDRDPQHRFILAMQLQRFNYRILASGSIVEALENLAVAVPALVITDVDLPGRGAFHLLEHLRLNPQTASTPVIGQLTNGADPATYLRAGFRACLHKPLQAEDLYRTVQALTEPVPRANIRIQTKLPVTVNGKPLDCVEGECASVLSEHGMYIRTLRPSPVKSLISVTLMIKGRAIPLTAEVRYSHRFGEGPFREPGMGLLFKEIASHDQEYIRQFIHEEVTRGIK
ncbi:MAG: response regulator [Nitrospirota bacterium]|nr:response regulator [Nitrospirota bacterium]